MYIILLKEENYMGSFGGFYKGDKKKAKKSTLEKKAQKQMSSSSYQLPQVEIVKKGKKEW
jgi:hypothetical protein